MDERMDGLINGWKLYKHVNLTLQCFKATALAEWSCAALKSFFACSVNSPFTQKDVFRQKRLWYTNTTQPLQRKKTLYLPTALCKPPLQLLSLCVSVRGEVGISRDWIHFTRLSITAADPIHTYTHLCLRSLCSSERKQRLFVPS